MTERFFQCLRKVAYVEMVASDGELLGVFRRSDEIHTSLMEMVYQLHESVGYWAMRRVPILLT